jgi:hypothetical protein
VIELGIDLTNRTETLIRGVIVLMGLVFILLTAARTRAIVPTVGAILFAAFVGWAVWNTDVFQDKIDDDIRNGAWGPPATVTADA